MTEQVTLWRSLLGNGVYTGKRDWMNRCVLRRVGLSLASIAFGMLLVYAYGSTADTYTAKEVWMLVAVVVYNLLFAAFLAFGAGRNYERVCLNPESCN